MKLTSRAFANNEKIPAKYTCEGDDISPPLSWSELPAATRSLALIVDDPDAPDPAAPLRTWVHCVIYNLPASSDGLHENVQRLTQGHFGLNDWNRAAWGGPCPPIGKHRYMFKLYALDRMLELARPSKLDLLHAMAGHVLAEAVLIGTYQKQT